MLLGLNRTQRGSERHTSIERKSERERERERVRGIETRESKACETECELSAEQPRVARGLVLKLKIKAKHRGLIEVAAGGHQAISPLVWRAWLFSQERRQHWLRLLENGINCQDGTEKFKDISIKMKSLLKMLLKSWLA